MMRGKVYETDNQLRMRATSVVLVESGTCGLCSSRQVPFVGSASCVQMREVSDAGHCLMRVERGAGGECVRGVYDLYVAP